MPVYQYYCKHCKITVELTKGMKDASKKEKCPDCGRVLTRKFENPALKFVGEGFHCNDY